MSKSLFTFILCFMVVVGCLAQSSAQNDQETTDKKSGPYVGVDAIFTSVDLWRFSTNKLELEMHTDNNFGSHLILSPVIGHRFNDTWRVEIAYQKKTYRQGLQTSETTAFSRDIYSAHIFSARVKADKNLQIKGLYIYPTLGLSYGHQDETTQASSSIDRFQSSTIYNRQNFTTIDLGLGLRFALHDSFSIQFQSLLMSGLDRIATVQYDDLQQVPGSQTSRVESKGSMVALSIGLQYYL